MTLNDYWVPVRRPSSSMVQNTTFRRLKLLRSSDQKVHPCLCSWCIVFCGLHDGRKKKTNQWSKSSNSGRCLAQITLWNYWSTEIAAFQACVLLHKNQCQTTRLLIQTFISSGCLLCSSIYFLFTFLYTLYLIPSLVFYFLLQNRLLFSLLLGCSVVNFSCFLLFCSFSSFNLFSLFRYLTPFLSLFFSSFVYMYYQTFPSFLRCISRISYFLCYDFFLYSVEYLSLSFFSLLMSLSFWNVRYVGSTHDLKLWPEIA
jgi:hypothetical protein